MSKTPKKAFNLRKIMRTIHLEHSFDVLDEFHSLLRSAAMHSEKRLQEEYEGITPANFEYELDMEDYRSILVDDFHQLVEVKKLGHALAISGLYRQVETHIKRVLRVTFPDIGKNKIKKIVSGEPQAEIDGSVLDGFDAVNELRMLNNLIKHAESIADVELANAYPGWVAGKELHDLDKAYDRLKPIVKRYVRAFVHEAYARSDAFEVASEGGTS